VADLSAKPRAGHCRHAAVAASSLSAPLATILSAPSGNGCCNALASSHGAHPNVTLFIGQRLNGQALNVTRAAAAPTRPKPRPASPDDLKARLSLWGQVKIKLGATCRGRLKRPLASSGVGRRNRCGSFFRREPNSWSNSGHGLYQPERRCQAGHCRLEYKSSAIDAAKPRQHPA
jgi:hypothetical protein